ncbi:methyltransferase type 11 [Halobacteriales archaeon QH_6_64_20]|nr:MAG: methyltransferase type 11 [Halobacteriales archaeon QH_6_64_20]
MFVSPPSLALGVASPDHGRRVYDWWSAHQGIYEGFVRLALFGRGRAARRLGLGALGLDPGEAVLDVGCGAGVNFDALAERVGSEGRIVGLDYSRGMVGGARERASANPIGEVHDVLRPGGRLAVVDARPFQEGLWRALNPLVTPISTYATNWQPDVDIVNAIRRTFADARCWTTNVGTLYVAVGRKVSDS